MEKKYLLLTFMIITGILLSMGCVKILQSTDLSSKEYKSRIYI